MNRPSIIQLYRTSLGCIFEKPEVPNLDFELVALPFFGVAKKRTIFQYDKIRIEKSA